MVVSLSDMHPYAWVWLLRVVDTAVRVSGHLEVTARSVELRGNSDCTPWGFKYTTFFTMG